MDMTNTVGGIQLNAARWINLAVNVVMLLAACLLRHLWNERIISTAQCMWLAWPIVTVWMLTIWNDRRIRLNSGSER